jgi:hypothetical protein
MGCDNMEFIENAIPNSEKAPARKDGESFTGLFE